MIIERAMIDTGITVTHAKFINLSYRDRGNVIRIVVSVIKIVVATITINSVFLLINSIAVRADIKIRAKYSAIKKIENIVP